MTGAGVPGTSHGPVRPWALRRVIGPLLAYHALVLAGGFLLVLGVVQGSTLERDVGAGVLAAGVATAVAVLAWSARLARAPRSAGSVGPVPRVCPRCGRTGPDGRTVCDRCGAPLVWAIRSN